MVLEMMYDETKNCYDGDDSVRKDWDDQGDITQIVLILNGYDNDNENGVVNIALWVWWLL